MAMLRHRANSDQTDPALLIYSSRTFEDIIYRGELDRLADKDPSLRVVHALTRTQPAGWDGYARRIDPDMLRDQGIMGMMRPNVFICGSSGMVESASQALVDLGVVAARIRTERFGPSG
jgi:ferredoxin-NADP reductase